MVDELDCPLIFEDESWFCPFDRCQVYLSRLNRNRNHYQSRYLAVRCYRSRYRADSDCCYLFDPYRIDPDFYPGHQLVFDPIRQTYLFDCHLCLNHRFASCPYLYLHQISVHRQSLYLYPHRLLHLSGL